jgi:biofilm PGA synthesis N-glycosyltransferase PgaC
MDIPVDQLVPMKVSIGVTAHNEAANIGQLLEALAGQETRQVRIDEILVVSSGSSDGTDEIVREWEQKDPRVKLLRQEHREGKASAINLFMREASHDILVLESADTIPGPITVEEMVVPFMNPRVGMSGGRPVPTNKPDTFIGFVVQLLWLLHHRLAVESPKLGEMVAFRKVFEGMPTDIVNDEAYIEGVITRKGYLLHYAPNAIIYNHGPQRILEFLRRRRVVYAGHLQLQKQHGYEPSTMSAKKTLGKLRRVLQGAVSWTPRTVVWVAGAVLLEAVGRLWGYVDFYLTRKNHAIWYMAPSARKVLLDD